MLILIFLVGLFKISIFGLILIYLVIIIFCWLFFDRWCVCVFDEVVLIVRCLIKRLINLVFCLWLMRFFGEKLDRLGNVIFLWIEVLSSSFLFLWFFVIKLSFFFIVFCGFLMVVFFLVIYILFEFSLLMLNSVFMIFVWLVFINLEILMILLEWM